MAQRSAWDAVGSPVSQPKAKAVADDWHSVGAPVAPPAPSARPGMFGGGKVKIPANTQPHDGDTFPLGNGQNGRLYGVDAPELGQTGFGANGVYSLGDLARGTLGGMIRNGGTATATGQQTFGRPVVTLDAGGDAGRNMVRQGMAFPEPRYLANDPARMSDYLAANRDAIADERGAYAGQFQMPSAFRQQGLNAPYVGKIPMTADQAAAFAALLRNPKTKPEQLEAWAASQGQKITNARNLISFMSRNPTARLPGYFQTQDVTGQPVQPRPQWFPTRQLGALNEGIADTLGAPVDILSAGLRGVGVPIPQTPFGGSASISSGLHRLGIGQVDQSYAPRSDAERYLQSVSRGVGQAAIPVGATLAAGSRIAASGAGAIAGAGRANVIRSALRTTAMEAAARPGLTIAAELGGGVGGGIGGQLARDVFPGNPWADMAGQIIGGGMGGFSAGYGVRRPLPIRERVIEATERGADAVGNQVKDQAKGAVRTAPASPWDAVGAPVSGSAGMANEAAPTPSLIGPRVGPDGKIMPDPQRVRDYLDIASPQRSGTFQGMPGMLGTPGTQFERATPQQLANLARTVAPGDILPIPRNTVASVDEAASIGEGMRPEMVPPNPPDQLPTYTLPGQTRQRSNPLDLAAWLRTKGGVQDYKGELKAIGIDNKPRDIPLAGDVGLPRLVNENGMSLDDASKAAWDAGYFPNHSEPPSIPEFLDALHETHRGGPARVFHPDDYAAIEAYHNAGDEAQAIDAAKASGAPWHQDKGQPVGLSDLEANQPPATAYEDLPAVWGKVGNIDVSKIATSEDIGRALSDIQSKVGGFEAATRGRVSQDETRALAQQMGMTADDLLKRRHGQALNAEEALAARAVHAKSLEELMQLARRAQGGTDSDVAAFRQAWLRHVAIEQQIRGATAEAGRTLNQFKMMASSKDVSGRIHKALIEDAGGRDNLENIAGMLLGLQDNPAAASKLARTALKPTTADKLSELYINSLLSGPQTHAANFLSNSLTAVLQIPEHAVAAGLGMVRRGADRVMPGEVPARAFGMLQGVREGLSAFRHTAMTGYVPDHVTKVEAAEQRAISGFKGSVIRTPTRMLSAADELFKGIARRMEINGLALRQARGEGLTGDKLKARIADLSSNPTPEMMEKAKDYARYVTFQRPLGEVGQAISRVSQWREGPLPIGKLIVPFVRTPANLMKFAAERSPAAPLLKEWRADMLAGGARRDLAIAKATIGTGIGLLFANLASKGVISGGGPADPGARDLLMADGWQPYSIKVGDTWYSYSRFDPVSMTMGVAADLATKGDKMTDAQRDNAAATVAASVIQNLGSKTWLSGVADLIHVMDNPSTSGAAYARNEAASMAVPGLLAQIARASDPYQRETKSVGDAIRSRIPVLSQNVPARLDAFGRPVTRETFPYGASAVLPVNVSRQEGNPTIAALLGSGANIGHPNRSVSGVKLTNDQMRSYLIESGKIAMPELQGFTTSPQWAGMTDAERQDEVSSIMRQSRETARANLGLNWSRDRTPVASRPAVLPSNRALTWDDVGQRR